MSDTQQYLVGMRLLRPIEKVNQNFNNVFNHRPIISLTVEQSTFKNSYEETESQQKFYPVQFKDNQLGIYGNDGITSISVDGKMIANQGNADITSIPWSIIQNVPTATSTQSGIVKVAASRNNIITAISGGQTPNRYYGVEIDSGGKLFVNVPWTGGSGGTDKYHTTGSWNNLTYTATAVNDAEPLQFTLPTGTTSTTVALGDHTHNYAGSSTVGGAATSANKLNTDAGSVTQPVYFTNGVPTVCNYALNKTVPSDAVFTDSNVTQTLTTSGNTYFRPILVGYSNSSASTPSFSTQTNTCYAAHLIYIKPSDGSLYATNLYATNLYKNGVEVSTLTLGNTSVTAAAGNHTHTTSLAITTGTSSLTLSYGEKYLLTAGGSGYRFTMPALGNTSTTAAAGDHTHSISLASDSGSSTIALSPNATYKLTAGGQSIIFTTPSNGDVDETIRVKKILGLNNSIIFAPSAPDYNADTYYHTSDIVLYNDVYYECTGYTRNIDPPNSTTDSEYWHWIRDDYLPSSMDEYDSTTPYYGGDYVGVHLYGSTYRIWKCLGTVHQYTPGPLDPHWNVYTNYQEIILKPNSIQLPSSGQTNFLTIDDSGEISSTPNNADYITNGTTNKFVTGVTASNTMLQTITVGNTTYTVPSGIYMPPHTSTIDSDNYIDNESLMRAQAGYPLTFGTGVNNEYEVYYFIKYSYWSTTSAWMATYANMRNATTYGIDLQDGYTSIST